MISSVYIHIPFCEKICHYCDFVKFFYDEKMADEYLDALHNEMATTIQQPKQKVQTIFVGGGTPTALNIQQLQRLVDMVDTYFDVSAADEYSFEANPGDLDQEKIKILKTAGVNRISMGVQDFDDQMLETLGRLHRVKDVYQNVNDLTKHGLTNISIDLMYSLPQQTLEGFNRTLDEALQFDLPHYSAYSLQIEPKTIFYQRYMKGNLTKPPEEMEAKMYDSLKKAMNEYGVHQYEISNFAKPGYESKHNLTYWNNQYYYGFGAGAHGYLPGERIINIRPFPAYVNEAKHSGKPVLHREPITKKEEIEEELFLGLRKQKGVSLDSFQEKYNYTVDQLYQRELDKLKERGWIEEQDRHIRLTDQGMLFGNEVFAAFLLEEEIT
ncbi:coproporphyrinogen III oxidase [Gracilibacillus halophilus YIM-C55.5]|uniref:Heme chaperone HemW n=1 Tax=Gracilibacillus halophilus YIM-C55.5 TaxID=1308866 RepID=N4WN12_9BACI|nr:radical SAM family heme chaperone HemW [Gracilibacillus halophilus]ENH97522.1 coproporphyrinogen III oxidase [Gracilibacillus halophilus YIM-C55.5]